MKISHIAIGCADLERVTAFYVQTLGIREAFRMARDEGPLRIVYLDAGPDCFIELLERDAEPVEPRRVGLCHVCLEVDDLKVELERLAALGVEAEGPPKQGCDGNLQAWIADPEGNRIELMQLLPEGRQRSYRGG
jgi:lactoylglutathione lyase